MHGMLKLLFIALFCLTLTQCAEHPVPPPDGVVHGETEPEGVGYYDESLMSKRDLARLDNEFGFRLFREIVGEHPDENVFISSLSVSMALGMTANGAGGSTRDAMLSTLGLEGCPMWLVNACYQNLMEQLSWSDFDVRFEIANSVWCREGLVCDGPFLNACRTFFDAQVRNVNFSAPGTPDTINAWVSRKTHGRIPYIVESPINPDMVVILLNALYFLGTWSREFDPADTDDDFFRLPDGTWEPCRMMERPGPDPQVDRPGSRFSYLPHDDFEAIDLPYGDSLFSMTIFLPETGIGVDSLISMFSLETWQEWMGSFCHPRGRIWIPKFELGFTYDLNDVLRALGMGVAFEPGTADFSGINDGLTLWIDRVVHKTYVRVDESGTEAAAVTQVDIPTGITPCPVYFEMYVNKPFVFVIRDNRWGTILFMGKVVNPGYF